MSCEIMHMLDENCKTITRLEKKNDETLIGIQYMDKDIMEFKVNCLEYSTHSNIRLMHFITHLSKLISMYFVHFFSTGEFITEFEHGFATNAIRIERDKNVGIITK